MIAQAVSSSIDPGSEQPVSQYAPPETETLVWDEPAPLPEEQPTESVPPTASPQRPSDLPAETPAHSASNDAVPARLSQRPPGRDEEKTPAASPPAAQKPAQPPPVPKGKRLSLSPLLNVLTALQRRQDAALPSRRVSLKAAEQSGAALVRISAAMAPLRYILVLLMAFALLGRRFSWMLLGFLGGAGGIYIAVIAAAISMLLAWQSILQVIQDGKRFYFSYETLLLLTTVLSLIEALLYQNEATLLPLLAISWCLSGTAALMTTRANCSSLRALITGRPRKGIRIAENRWEHMDCIGKTSASTSGFVRHQSKTDTLHSLWSFYGAGLMIAALILSARLSMTSSIHYLTALVTLLTVSLPVSLLLCCARPYELLVRAMHGAGVVSGWYGIRSLSGKKALLIYDEDLFPAGAIGHKGVKVYGRQTPKLLVSYAASLVLRADNGLRDVFTGLVRETGGKLYEVSCFQPMEAGLAGLINNIPVAVGTYHFMQLLGAIPPADAPKNGIYIALEGKVAGVFAITYRIRGGAVSGFDRIRQDRNLTALIATRNFCVNPAFLENGFQVSLSTLTCPKLETRMELSNPSLLAHGTTCGYSLKDGISVYSRLVVGGRRVYRMGLMLTLLSILLSLLMLITTALRLSSGGAAAGGTQLLLYQLPLLLLLELWARFSAR